ncbi:MAG: TonB-dependent receptor [Bacteroidales bacterium]|nr:TonB-dependent receptor [Bacteroidales bacterium]
MNRRILLLCAGLFAAVAMSAQNYSVTVTLQDGQNGDPVGFATVSLTPAKGQAKYALSDSQGKAVVEKVKAGRYTLKAEIMGYKPYTRSVDVAADVNLGTVKLDLDQEVLDAAKVSATGNPIVIKKDTVEYNASSFKISENNVLEDLLKKLPGVEVAEDGSITANGETITKITIDGKTFFLDDPQLASKNIPAKIVEKVKVVKKKSEQAEFTGIDDGEDETVIDLSVKKGMMNGIFGNAMLGGGHDIPQSDLGWKEGDWRYQGSFMGGRFSDKSQISILANGNNTNNRGFNDMAGSMMNSMMGSGGGMGRSTGGFGRTGNGIITSWMGGVNGNWDLLGDKMDLGANYLYNGTKTDVLEDTYKETYLEDGSTLVSDNSGFSNSDTYGHRFGVQLEHKFSENTSILFRPQVNFGGGDYTQSSRFTTLTDDGLAAAPDTTNRGFTNNTGKNKNWQTQGFFLFRQRLGMPGRTVSLSVNYNFSNNILDSYNQSVTQNYEENAVSGDPDLVNQRIHQDSKTRSISSRLVYTEPLGHNLYLEGSYRIAWNRNNTDKDAFNSGPFGPSDYNIFHATMDYFRPGETPDADYSNAIENRYLNQSAGVAFMYQEGKTRAQLGLSANPTKTHNVTNGVSYDDSRVNWAPRAMLFYDFNDNSNVRLFYFGRSAQPSTSQLMPVLDNSNPLSMALGNPYLTPYFNHSLRSDLEYSNKQTFFTARLHLEGSYVQDPIVSALWYDNGVQYSMPVNGDDSFSANARLMINAPIAKSNFSLMNMTRLSYSKSGSYIGGSAMTGKAADYFNEDKTSFDYQAFHDELPFDEYFTSNITRSLTAMERIRATYRTDNFEFIVGGRTRFNKPWYTLSSAVSNATWSNQVSSSVSWTLGDSGFEFTTDADYNWYDGYTTPQDPEFVWNATLSKLLLRKQATLALKGYDILNQAKNLTVTDASNYHSEVRNNTLGRYVILSFTWRFGNFGKAGQQMRQRMGSGRGPGGGRPPMM